MLFHPHAKLTGRAKPGAQWLVLECLGSVLVEQADSVTPARLLSEMSPYDPDRALAWLEAMLVGLLEHWRK